MQQRKKNLVFANFLTNPIVSTKKDTKNKQKRLILIC